MRRVDPVRYRVRVDRTRSRREHMAVAKVIEITASSPTSFAEAVKVGITKASETVHGIKGAWVSEESVVVENDQVTEFRVTMRVSFVLD
jgi:flavin-binding protein dodecin